MENVTTGEVKAESGLCEHAFGMAGTVSSRPECQLLLAEGVKIDKMSLGDGGAEKGSSEDGDLAAMQLGKADQPIYCLSDTTKKSRANFQRARCRLQTPRITHHALSTYSTLHFLLHLLPHHRWLHAQEDHPSGSSALDSPNHRPHTPTPHSTWPCQNVATTTHTPNSSREKLGANTTLASSAALLHPTLWTLHPTLPRRYLG
ncbi:hypothetical protein QC762_0064970 [Podospora pseudocomata]|uniref:Uncharacterized protein n=1 Tax=Podospora pseudocomata TaxID=2093779 RepID=A0ABR0GFA0_9PEZI|nr:hypothetical protein QC762_0064970 [Podospora pseudocomata]